jgi:hypothetical protein
MFLLILSIVLVAIFILWWGWKNRKIRALQNKLAILNAKLNVERLEVKYDLEIAELRKLKEKEKNIRDDIDKIEKSLETKLKPDMTADEIIAKFKEIGIRD